MVKRLKREYDLYLKDILESISRIEDYVGLMNLNSFKESKMTVDAVLRNLEIIGEAVTNIPKEVRDKYDRVPWRDVQDFRIVVAHHYWKINLDRVWDIIENKLGPLKKQIEDILDQG